MTESKLLTKPTQGNLFVPSFHTYQLGEPGWINCEDGFNLPPRQLLVGVAYRTLEGYGKASAFWQSIEFSDPRILSRLALLQGAELDEFVMRYRHSLVWSTADLKTLKGVVAWFNVPSYQPF